MSLRNALARAGYAIAAALLLFVSLGPLAVAVSSSLKQREGLFSPELIPAAPTLANYAALFRDQPFALNLLNSLLVASGVVALSLLIGLMAAWALARVSFRGRGLLLFTILAASMFPQVAVLAGMFELVTALGMYDHLGALMFADL
ncbi:MAG TPA: carbohydrate ABC transporter permease, partial [Ideonella sp.]|nr:carbohydrate ABC transporter permease [Ideonella sp.]